MRFSSTPSRREKSELDEKDLSILRLLRENSRMSYNEIARALNMSDVAVIKRIKRLEQLEIIKRYTVAIDPSKLGFNVVSITGIDVRPERLFHILSILKKKEYVDFLALTSGDHPIMAVIWARDNDELARIHDEISRLPGVERVCPALLLEIVKEGGFPNT